jgi:hypothetical protein
VDLIVGLWVKSDMLRIPFLWVDGWIPVVSIAVGIVVLIVDCVAGYVSHEAFNQAVAPNGEM